MIIRIVYEAFLNRGKPGKRNNRIHKLNRILVALFTKKPDPSAYSVTVLTEAIENAMPTPQPTGQTRQAACHASEDRIYAAATDFSETLSMDQLRAFITEALCWHRLLILRH